MRTISCAAATNRHEHGRNPIDAVCGRPAAAADQDAATRRARALAGPARCHRRHDDVAVSVVDRISLADSQRRRGFQRLDRSIGDVLSDVRRHHDRGALRDAAVRSADTVRDHRSPRADPAHGLGQADRDRNRVRGHGTPFEITTSAGAPATDGRRDRRRLRCRCARRDRSFRTRRRHSGGAPRACATQCRAPKVTAERRWQAPLRRAHHYQAAASRPPRRCRLLALLVLPHPAAAPAAAAAPRSRVQAASVATLAETLPSSVRTSELWRAPITI